MLDEAMLGSGIGRYDRGIGGASGMTKYLLSFIIAEVLCCQIQLNLNAYFSDNFRSPKI